MLTTDERKALVIYRIEKAKRVFKEAKDNAKLEHWNLAGNRLYYTVYHMAHALLLYKGFSAKTHAGTIHLIGQKFIATNILTNPMGGYSHGYTNCVNRATTMICLTQRKKRFCLTLSKWKHSLLR